MFLNIWTTIRTFFTETFSKIPWSSIFILLTGIIIGFLICGIMYLIIVLSSLKKIDKNNKKEYSEEDIVKTNDVNKLINGAKDELKEESKDLSISAQIDLMTNISWQLINDIAKVYYPDSKYPLFELSVEELIKLCEYITNKIDSIFNGKLTKYARNFKMSQLMSIIDAKKKMDDNKIIKAAKKVHIEDIYKVVNSTKNLFNPLYWIKKVMISSTLNIGVLKIFNIIIDIVGQETAKVYSKNIFKENMDVNLSIENLENEISGE